jgi:hypothetical protein
MTFLDCVQVQCTNGEGHGPRIIGIKYIKNANCCYWYKAVQDMHSELIFVGVFYQISVLVLT